MTIADQIIQQSTQGFTKAHLPGPIQISADDLMKRITALQEAGYILNARLQREQGQLAPSLVVQFTTEGMKDIIMRDLGPEAFDVEFLEDQIAEYSDKVPKAFLEGLKAAEGILRGTDYLENYIEK